MRVVLRRWVAVIALVGASGACQLVVGVESRSERAAESTDAAASDAAMPLPTSTAPLPVGCAVGETTCGVLCIDLANDPKNCGACGHDCLGAACLGMQCEPERIVAEADGLVVAVDDTEVFYRAESDAVALSPLRARNKSTGAERTPTLIGRYHDAALDGDFLVLLDNAPSPRIRRVKKENGASITLHSQPSLVPAFRSVTVAGRDIFWTTRSDIRRIRNDGSSYGTIKTTNEPPDDAGLGLGASEITTSDDRIYFGVEDHPGLFSFPRLDTNGKLETVDMSANGLGVLSSVVRVGTTIFWTSGSRMNIVPGVGAPIRESLGLRNAHSVATAKDGTIYIYDVVFGVGPEVRDSRIVRFDPTTRASLVLATGLRDGRLVVDETHVYFAYYPRVGSLLPSGLFRIAR